MHDLKVLVVGGYGFFGRRLAERLLRRPEVEVWVAGRSAARRAGVAVVSGASSVPALSCAAADALAHDLERVEAIDIGISPGHRTERGLSTMRAVLGYCGQALPGAGAQRRYGWVGTRSRRYPPPVGTRLLSPCDVADERAAEGLQIRMGRVYP